jgi:UDP-N-acetylmuramoyl-L-alanyl-D-glutamate--2,6-diaminopimelate ligase
MKRRSIQMGRCWRRSTALRLGDAMAQYLDIPNPSWARAARLEISGITADSRKVAPGYLFAALPGSRADGSRFIAEPLARGAVAVLAPTGTLWPPGVPPRPLIEDGEPRRRLAQLASAFAGPQPGTVVAVTGTNGKTSTVDFLRQIWEAAGRRAACMGTLGVTSDRPIPGLPTGPALTTADPVALSQTMAALARTGVQHAALEASSHGLDQFRLDGLRLAAGAFTNLTRDHLDYHGTEAAYRAAKLRLFGALLPQGAPAVVPSGLDGETHDALRAMAGAGRIALHEVGESGGLIRLHRVTPRADGQVLDVIADGQKQTVLLPLIGRFQADNALLAAGLAGVLGDAGAVGRLAALTGVRGRLELAARLDNGAAAYVDYAHTPDALRRLLAALRPHTTGRVVMVFGAGGDRDPGKRALMGEAASGADVVIVTDDNPRSEDPAAIRAAVRSGCPGALEIGDRAAAIAAGLAALRPGDVLAVAGKGHEQGQILGDIVLPFDDAAVIRRLAGGG